MTGVMKNPATWQQR